MQHNAPVKAPGRPCAAGSQAFARRDLSRATAARARFGNAGTSALLADRQPLRPKLEVGAVSDPLEREADSTADQVVRMKAGGDCSACARGDPCDGGAKVRRSSGGGGSPAMPLAPAAEASVRRGTSGGEPLPAPVRESMEPRFGADFSGVRVHRDAAAADSARGIGARAYTVGNHIAFGASQWAPGTDRGDRLIAHELTHTLQDGGGVRRSLIQRQAGPDEGPGDAPGLSEQLDIEVQGHEISAAQDPDPELRAYAARLVLLLRRPRAPFTQKAELDAFVEEAVTIAISELATLIALGDRDEALRDSPTGFPIAWAWRIYAALTLGANSQKIVAGYELELEQLNGLAATLPDALIASGLPLSASEASKLQRFILGVDDQARTGAVAAFARAAVRYARLRFIGSFLMMWEEIAIKTANAVADGSSTFSDQDYVDFVQNEQVILRALPARMEERAAASAEELQALQSDVRSLQDVVFVAGLASAFASLGGWASGWQQGAAIFNGAMAKTDARIGGVSGGHRISYALRWASANGYFGAARSDMVDQLIDSAPGMLARTGVSLAALMTPGVNILAVGYLFLESAFDLASLVYGVVEAFDEAADAKKVVPLQRASVNLARTLTGAVAELVVETVTAGVARGASAVGSRSSRASDPRSADPAAGRRAASNGATLGSQRADQAAAKEWEASLSPYTVDYLKTHKTVHELYLSMEPGIREMFTHCSKLCILPNISRPQISRVAGVVKRLGPGAMGRLKIYFHIRRNDVDDAIDELVPMPTVDALDSLLQRALVRKGNPRTAPIHVGGASTRMRNSPGVAGGGERLPRVLPGKGWLGKTGGNAGLIPAQVAERLRQRPFDSFDKMKEAFWIEVASIPELAGRFNSTDLVEMRQGRAPSAPPALQKGGASGGRYTLHHITPIAHGGGVYDLDNLIVVSPRLHASTIHRPTAPMPAPPTVEPE